jgi:hypothetical protein
MKRSLSLPRQAAKIEGHIGFNDDVDLIEACFESELERVILSPCFQGKLHRSEDRLLIAEDIAYQRHVMLRLGDRQSGPILLDEASGEKCHPSVQLGKGERSDD